MDPFLNQQAEPDLNLAMRQAATAYGLHGGNQHEQEATTGHQELWSLVSAIRRDKQDLHMAIHSDDPHTQQSAQSIAAQQDTSRRQLKKWHKRRAKDVIQGKNGISRTPSHTNH